MAGWLVTLSHTEHLAQAVVVALGPEPTVVIPVLTPDEMGEVDRAAPEPVDVLIDRAGAAVARAAVAMLGGTYGRRVVVVVGKGNNGNDGRAAARRLARRGVGVRLIAVERRPDDAARGRPRHRRRLRHRVPGRPTGAPDLAGGTARCWPSTSLAGSTG